MSYRIEKQSDGQVTIRDLAIFATCKAKGVEADEDWIFETVDHHRAVEANSGYRPPIHVAHTDPKTGRPVNTTEDAAGLASNFRATKVAVGKEKRLGIVCDFVDVDPEVAERIVKQNLHGRSVEIPPGEKRIRSVALCGATSPFHQLRQGSEVAQFSEADGAMYAHFNFGSYPAAPVEEPSLMSALQELIELVQAQQANIETLVSKMAEDAAAQKEVPAEEPLEEKAEEPKEDKPPFLEEEKAEDEAEEPVEEEAAEEEAVEEEAPEPVMMSEVENLKNLIEQLAAENAQLKATQEPTPEPIDETEAALKQFADAGFAFDPDAQRQTIEAIGLERWKSSVACHFTQAPVEASSPARQSKKDEAFVAFSEDETLKQFAELDDAAKSIALAAATDYDRLATEGRAPCSDRKSYIEVCLRHEGK